MRDVRLVRPPRFGAIPSSFALALLGRAAIAARGPIVTPDTGGYRAAAEAFRSSPLATGPAIDLPPVFPLLLAVVTDERAVLVLLVLASAAVAPLLAVAAGRHYGNVAAWAAGVLVAVSPTFVMWTPYLLTDVVGLFFGALAIERASAAWTTETRRGPVQLGLALAAAFLTRAAFSAMALATFVVAVAQRRHRTAILAAVAAAALIAIPVARNAIAAGEFVPYRSQTLLLLWAGTTWDERGRGTGGIDINYPPGHETWTRAERESYYAAEIDKALRERPLDVAGRAMRKTLWLWLPFYPDWSRTHQIVNGAFFVLIYVAAAYGAVVRWRDAFARLLLAHIIVVTAVAAVTIVDFDARYRLPAELALIPLAAAGIAAAAIRVTRR